MRQVKRLHAIAVPWAMLRLHAQGRGMRSLFSSLHFEENTEYKTSRTWFRFMAHDDHKQKGGVRRDEGLPRSWALALYETALNMH